MIKSEQNTFMFSRDIGVRAKYKVGHCDLILLCFFYFYDFEYQGSTNVSVNFITNYI